MKTILSISSIRDICHEPFMIHLGMPDTQCFGLPTIGSFLGLDTRAMGRFFDVV